MIDPATHTVVATVPVGKDPVAVDFSPTGSLAYVVNQVSNSLSVILTATNEVITTVPLSSGGGTRPTSFGKFIGPNLIAAGNLQLRRLFKTVSEAGRIDKNGRLVHTADMRVIRTGGSQGVVSVVAITRNGTALAGSDYVYKCRTITFADGDTTPKHFRISIIEDTAPEPDETVHVVLKHPTGGADLGYPHQATLTIMNDDV